MKLSELKALRPDVWEVFRDECVRQYGESDFCDSVNEDLNLSCCFLWDDTNQKRQVWESINKNSDFTLFDKWMEENRPKESEPIEPDPKFSIGAKVRITKCIYGHEFEIGEIVTIIRYQGDDDTVTWQAINDKQQLWWISEEEGEAVIAEPKPEQPVKRITIQKVGESIGIKHEGIELEEAICFLESAKISLILKSMGK